MKFEDYECSQCGARDFTEEGKDKLRCNYCDSFLNQSISELHYVVV